MTAVMAYWNQLHVRERAMLLIAGVCCFFYLFYALFYSPLTSAVNQATAQLAEQQSTLAWMKRVRQEYTKTKATKTLSNGQLLTVLGSQLNQVSFHRYPYQLEQTGSGDIQLSFDDVPYTLFVVWFRKFSQQYTCLIKQFNVDKTKTSGVVKVMVVLSAS
ncbi:MAG: type II secretion system protein GspM [Legionellaceae bacterium]|nr:type II secretion system protein GspM [Legionellaceae bacterium]